MDDFAGTYGPWALIAGASEGIGAGFARALAARGLNLALLARRAEPLEDLAQSIRHDHGVEVRHAAIDLTAPGLLDAVGELIGPRQVGLLVYNAGAVHGARYFLDRPLDDALALVELNCRSPLQLTHTLGSAMADRGRGGIILMSSLAAASGSAYTAVYAATKAFDQILAESLWMELGPKGVDVLGVMAGLTDTPAMRTSGVRLDGAGFVPMAADAVAGEALDALGTNGPLHVVGEANRTAAAGFWPVPRSDLVAAMSASAASLYGLPVPLPPR